MENNKQYPLMLVFYMDRELMGTEMMGNIAMGINDAIVQKDANAMAFFVPTDGEERIECINPMMVQEAEMSKINKIVEDIKKGFDIGQGADKGKNDPENEVSILEGEDDDE